MSSLLDIRPCPGECGNNVRGDRLACQRCWLQVPCKQRNELSVELVNSAHSPPYRDPQLVDKVLVAIRVMVESH